MTVVYWVRHLDKDTWTQGSAARWRQTETLPFPPSLSTRQTTGT